MHWVCESSEVSTLSRYILDIGIMKKKTERRFPLFKKVDYAKVSTAKRGSVFVPCPIIFCIKIKYCKDTGCIHTPTKHH